MTDLTLPLPDRLRLEASVCILVLRQRSLDHEATVPNDVLREWLTLSRVVLFPQPMKLDVCHGRSHCLFPPLQKSTDDLDSQLIDRCFQLTIFAIGSAQCAVAEVFDLK